jgi:hypothetical protein
VSIAIARGYLRIWGHSPSAQLSRQPPPLRAQIRSERDPSALQSAANPQPKVEG